ncbi:MAG TPA: UDP-N-acetylmuramoyl-tripeptide--D-alanyl-D-alanine ligase [Microthrixaceae bacterium]|nr:UDP-N-acetylmuramoyl-tripeptide--D-alanyl-D-alanine ligase [Microthrixaceae bacterium]
MRVSLRELAAGIGGSVVGDGGVVVDGASVDSRTLSAGQLFVAVVADRDGHDFVRAAAGSGAAAALVSQPLPDVTIPQVVVDDTERALLAAGRLARDRLPAPVVAITGSVGKTTSKDLAASVLAQQYVTAASERSFNNELGVPITLLGAPDGTTATVVEMGARGLGHIRALCEVTRPTIGVVTVVAAAHTELFGSIDDIATAKGELVEALGSSDTAVLNTDDRRVAAMSQRSSARVLRFGTGGDVRAEGIELGADLYPRFRLVTPDGSVEVRLGVAGRHNVTNALAAASIGVAAGVGLDHIATGLAHASISPWRMEVRRLESGATLLNDAYNANPTSMAAALHALAELDAERRIAVLGPMAELGADAARAHAEVAALARTLDIEIMAMGTDAYGSPQFELDDGGVEAVADRLEAGDATLAVLVKASRMAGLERVVERLLDP